MLRNIIALVLGATLIFAGAPIYAKSQASTTSLTTQEEEDMLYIREEEKVARDTYVTSYDLWDLVIFSNIATSEQSHMDAMLKLLKKYNLSDPAAGNEIGEFTNQTLQNLYNTLADLSSTSGLSALKVGGLIEETDIRDITAAISRSQHTDITKVYETLMCGSRNHLRGFAQTIEAYTGEPYVAQVLTAEEVNQVLSSPMEKCGPQKGKSALLHGKQ